MLYVLSVFSFSPLRGISHTAVTNSVFYHHFKVVLLDFVHCVLFRTMLRLLYSQLEK